MIVGCEVEEVDLEGDVRSVDGVAVTCRRCAHQAEAYGTSGASVRACFVMLREQCPRGESNFYEAVGGWDDDDDMGYDDDESGADDGGAVPGPSLTPSPTATMVVPAPPAVADVRLSAEQGAILAKLLAGAKCREPLQTLGGYAGTGKTTLVGTLVRELPGWAVCAYTGKAASILRRKGVDASTIHSLIYRLHPDSTPSRPLFVRRASLDCRGLIIDEASMVGRETFDDLRSYGLPIIAVGDHGQLPPVNSDFNLMANPDHRLETIHRNAGEIARFAEWVRHGNEPREFAASPGGPVEFPGGGELDERGLWTDVDQIICGTNPPRVRGNKIVRDLLGHGAGGRHLVVGERVMCLQNSRERGVYNGVQGIVTGCRQPPGGTPTLDLDSYGERRPAIPYDPGQFHRVTRPESYSHWRIPFDYAYCITCHKAQGDEFGTTLVFEERCRLWDPTRWAYTAASRARTKIHWAHP